jgi:hypothetical protein
MRRSLFILTLFATALVAAGELSGRWNFVWSTPGGERHSTLTFQVEGKEVRVQFPDSKTPVTGTLSGDEFSVSGKLYSAEAGVEGDFRMSGKVAEGRLTGTASWQEHTMTFTAQRAE